MFESLPFTDTEVGTSYTYDTLGRVKTKTTAGKITIYGYGRTAEGSTVAIAGALPVGGLRSRRSRPGRRAAARMEVGSCGSTKRQGQ